MKFFSAIRKSKSCKQGGESGKIILNVVMQAQKQSQHVLSHPWTLVSIV